MKKTTFAEIDENSLFWVAKNDAPENPHDFYGPFKKKIYREFYDDAPDVIFVRCKKPSLAELILSKKKMRATIDRPN